MAMEQARLKSASPAARRRAVATVARLRPLRYSMAQKYGEKPSAFGPAQLLKTIQRHEIAPALIPPALLDTLGKRARAKLLAKRANGHDAHPGGVGIPLDAIPERKGKPNGVHGNAGPKHREHPNASLIGKVIDLLAKPDTTPDVAARLLDTLDKLLV